MLVFNFKLESLNLELFGSLKMKSLKKVLEGNIFGGRVCIQVYVGVFKAQNREGTF